VLYTGEELGLLGSSYFTENPPVPLKDIIANINIDMIGCLNTDVKGLAPIGASGVSSKLKEVIIKVGEKNKEIPLDWTYEDANPSLVSRSDNYSFQLKKIPAVLFFTGFNSDYHKPSDDAEKIDYEILQKSCKLIYDVILELANGNVSLKD
jgi:Zn-dependent M28 family amino/carboxypeptidase